MIFVLRFTGLEPFVIGQLHAWATLLLNNPHYTFDRWLVGLIDDGLNEMAKRTVHAPAEKRTTVFKRVASHFTD